MAKATIARPKACACHHNRHLWHHYHARTGHRRALFVKANTPWSTLQLLIFIEPGNTLSLKYFYIFTPSSIYHTQWNNTSTTSRTSCMQTQNHIAGSIHRHIPECKPTLCTRAPSPAIITLCAPTTCTKAAMCAQIVSDCTVFGANSLPDHQKKLSLQGLCAVTMRRSTNHACQ